MQQFLCCAQPENIATEKKLIESLTPGAWRDFILQVWASKKQTVVRLVRLAFTVVAPARQTTLAHVQKVTNAPVAIFLKTRSYARMDTFVRKRHMHKFPVLEDLIALTDYLKGIVPKGSIVIIDLQLRMTRIILAHWDTTARRGLPWKKNVLSAHINL